jgi:hypothetical protein
VCVCGLDRIEPEGWIDGGLFVKGMGGTGVNMDLDLGAITADFVGSF